MGWYYLTIIDWMMEIHCLTNLSKILVMQGLQVKPSISMIRVIRTETRLVSKGNQLKRDSYHPWICSLSILLSCSLFLTKAIAFWSTLIGQYRSNITYLRLHRVLPASRKASPSLLFCNTISRREDRESCLTMMHFSISYISASIPIHRNF